ncbi:transglycosylase SLT domain-containing protein [Paradesertivirga mongoliensis]|uniref:Transglycosylase SLT domain-containing protein n=1 Tax=Paradesertivirga mongoliensis TaxID=2100740 RepID=A0ABW4ZIM5_9SPHI|nr:lytic transglycosylase domain-containing protein [Pedobacter mongoliensis]
MKRTIAYTLVLFSGVGLLGFSLDTKASEKSVNMNSPAKADPAYRLTLENLQKTVPLTYNESVQKLIDSYASQKQRFSKMLGLSKYYFPIYERVFKEKGLPDELKYLSVVESALNPHATSWVGATGLWQFLEPVGRIYGLTINDTLDERKDPLLASSAAADYLLKSYAMYNDWLLAIASYNCGHNNIRWARENAGGGNLDYWTIRKHLPAETQSYVPAFIATVYIMNNHKRHGIYPADAGFNIFTNTMQVNRRVSLWNIAKATNTNIDVLTLLNPSYKNQILHGTPEKPKKLIIPEIKPYIYTALRAELLKSEPVQGELYLSYVTPESDAPSKPSKYVARDVSVSYRVQEGDTLSSIAEKFNGTEEEIKVINKLKHSVVKPGMVLRIIQG